MSVFIFLDGLKASGTIQNIFFFSKPLVCHFGGQVLLHGVGVCLFLNDGIRLCTDC